MLLIQKILKLRIRNKIDTPENWTKNNPVLLDGELGLEPNGYYKLGYNNKSWNELPYVNGFHSVDVITDGKETTNSFVVNPILSGFNNPSIKLYRVSKNTEIQFVSIANTLYFEKLIYIGNTSNEPIELHFIDAEWANDALNTLENNRLFAGNHLFLKARWIDNRVILQVVDNDQLADQIM